jgi:hypothetical protein
VRDPDVGVDPSTYAALGYALEDQHDLVVGEVGDQQRLVKAPGGAGAVLPPPVGATADDVRGVDDEDPHLRYLLKSLGRSRAAAAFS